MIQVNRHDAATNFCSWLSDWKSCSTVIPQESISQKEILVLWVLTGLSILLWILWPIIIKKFKSLNDSKSPIEIIFDPANPAKKFWSVEPMRDRDDNPIPGSFWEYRIEIMNKSEKTLRNVKVAVESNGLMPIRQAAHPFDKNKKTEIDINPGCSELAVVLRWPNPKIQAGMLAGQSAREYGPKRVIVSADDTVQAERVFNFDYQVEPMIFD